VSSPTPPPCAAWARLLEEDGRGGGGGCGGERGGGGGGGGGRLYSCLTLELCTLCNSDMCTLQLCILFFSLCSLYSPLTSVLFVEYIDFFFSFLFPAGHSSTYSFTTLRGKWY